MEHELYGEAHLTDIRRTAAAIDAHGWKNPAPPPRYRVAIARVLIALANRIAPTAITSPVIDMVTAYPYGRHECSNRADLER